MAESTEPVYTRTELVWPGKHIQVTRITLSFQIVETVNQSSAMLSELCSIIESKSTLGGVNRNCQVFMGYPVAPDV